MEDNKLEAEDQGLEEEVDYISKSSSIVEISGTISGDIA